MFLKSVFKNFTWPISIIEHLAPMPFTQNLLVKISVVSGTSKSHGPSVSIDTSFSVFRLDNISLNDYVTIKVATLWSCCLLGIYVMKENKGAPSQYKQCVLESLSLSANRRKRWRVKTYSYKQYSNVLDGRLVRVIVIAVNNIYTVFFIRTSFIRTSRLRFGQNLRTSRTCPGWDLGKKIILFVLLMLFIIWKMDFIVFFCVWYNKIWIGDLTQFHQSYFLSKWPFLLFSWITIKNINKNI